MNPEETQAALNWLARNSIDIQKSEVTFAPAHVSDHAWFNCETGLLAISTEIFPPCNECELPSQCTHFPRDEVISCMTGDGDGDYLVWALHSKTPASDSTYVADGALILLDSEIHSSIKYKYGKLFFEASPLAPILLGTIEVSQHESSQGIENHGFLFISDEQATANSDYFHVDLAVTPGKYQVIAFMGDAQFYPFTPRVVGIYGEYFAEAVNETLKDLQYNVASQFDAEILGTEDGTVLSRMGNDLDSLSEKNSAINYDRHPLLSDSWAFQRYFAGSERIKKKIEEFSPKSNYSVFQWLQIADGLRIRGQKAESNRLINELLGSNLKILDEDQKYLVSILRAKPGVWPA